MMGLEPTTFCMARTGRFSGFSSRHWCASSAARSSSGTLERDKDVPTNRGGTRVNGRLNSSGEDDVAAGLALHFGVHVRAEEAPESAVVVLTEHDHVGANPPSGFHDDRSRL